MGLRWCLRTSIFIETPSLEGLPTKAKEDPSPHEMRQSPAGPGIIIIVIIVYVVYVPSKCTDLVEKLVRFPQGLSFVLYLYFRMLKMTG